MMTYMVRSGIFMLRSVGSLVGNGLHVRARFIRLGPGYKFCTGNGKWDCDPVSLSSHLGELNILDNE